MNVKSYIYQSPSPQSVQFGRLDPSSKSSDSSQTTESNLGSNKTFQDAQNFQSTQVSEVKPTVKSENTLDIYA